MEAARLSEAVHMAMVQLAASRVARAAAAAQVVRFELSTVEAAPAAAVSVLWQGSWQCRCIPSDTWASFSMSQSRD